MANYKEEIIDGEMTKWMRADQIIINNPYDETPHIIFHEEYKGILPDAAVINLPTENITIIDEAFTDPTTVINLVHPETGASLGTATYEDLQVILHSLYLQLAAARDAE